MTTQQPLPAQARRINKLQQELHLAREELARQTAIRAAAQKTKDDWIKERTKETLEHDPDYLDLLDREKNLKTQESVQQLAENGKAKREFRKAIQENLDADFQTQDNDLEEQIRLGQEAVDRMAEELESKREQVIQELAAQ